MKKRFMALAAAIALLLSSMPVFASKPGTQGGNSVLEMYIDSYAAYINGEYRQIDDNFQVTPIIIDSRTLVPARFVGEVFGCEVLWNDDAREVTIRNEKDTIKTVIDEKTIDVNGKKEAIDVPAQILNDRTVLPLRAIAEALGKTVEYDNGLIAIGDEAAVEVYMNGNLEDIIRDKFKCNMRLKKELKRRTSMYDFTTAIEYNNGVLVSHIPSSNGGFKWQRGNVPYSELPVDESAEWAYSFTIYNNRLYYNIGGYGSSWDWPASIYSCNLDGSDIQLLTDDAGCASGTIVNNKLYYASYYDFDSEYFINEWGPGDGNINVIDLQTGQKSTLLPGKPEGSEKGNRRLHISEFYDDVMIYTLDWNEYHWYDLTNGDSGKISESELLPYHCSNSECNVFFYSQQSNKSEIKVLYKDTGEENVLVTSNNYIHIVNVTDKYIYYQELEQGNTRQPFSKINRIQRPDV